MTPETVLDAIKDKNVIVFDGECVLCSGFFRFVLKRDMQRQFHFMIAQSEAGEALYRHFDLKPNDYDTNLVLIEGKLFESCLLYTSPSPRDKRQSRMPSSA